MNSNKCHLLVAGHKFEQIWAKIGTDLIWGSNSVKLLGITIDNHLKFDKHISLSCAKGNRKFIIFLDSTKLKIVWTKITTFFKRRVSIIL